VSWTPWIVALLVALGAPAEGRGALDPLLSLRADHMVLDAAIRADRILVATQSGRIQVFDWRRGLELPTLLSLAPETGRELAPTVPCVALSPSARWLAAASSGDQLWLLELDARGDGVGRRVLASARALTCRFLDESRLLLGTLRGELVLLDVEQGRESFRRQLDYDPVYAVSVSPDRARVAVALRSSRIHIVEPETGRSLRILEGHRDSVFALDWVSDDVLVSASKDKRVLRWDLTVDPARTRTLHHGDRPVTALAVEPARGRLAVTLDDHRIGLLNLADGRVIRRLVGHSAPVQRLAFVDGGKRLISTGHDARVLVWDVAPAEEGRAS